MPPVAQTLIGYSIQVDNSVVLQKKMDTFGVKKKARDKFSFLFSTIVFFFLFLFFFSSLRYIPLEGCGG